MRIVTRLGCHRCNRATVGWVDTLQLGLGLGFSVGRHLTVLQVRAVKPNRTAEQIVDREGRVDQSFSQFIYYFPTLPRNAVGLGNTFFVTRSTKGREVSPIYFNLLRVL